jgi:serine/threonine protein kinase
MAPEQICGEPVDGRTDLWALGVTLYEVLTGRRPFDGEVDVSVAHAIVHAEPARPSAVRPDIPGELEAMLVTLLQKAPADRPATADQVASELGAMEVRPTISSGRSSGRRWPAAGWRSSRGRRMAAGVFAVAALVVAAGIVLARWPAPQPAAAPDERSVAVLPFENMSGDSQQEYLSDGITEELTSHLARLPGLRVVARASTFQFKGTNADVRDVGKALGVAA